MPDFPGRFFVYLAVMAGTTYLVRLLPLLLVRHRITNRILRSFLYYVPYVVLSAMTFPAILYSTGSMISAAFGAAVALVLAYVGKSLLTVSASSAAAVLICELIVHFLGN